MSMWTNHADPITVVPPNYREVDYIKITNRRAFLWLNVMSLLPLTASGLLMFGALLVYHEEMGGPLVIPALSGELPSLVGLLLVLLVLPLHEWIHGLAIRRCGHTPRYGVKLLVLFATSDGALFRRNEFILIALAPLVTVTLAGLFVMVFLPYQLGYWIALAVVLNAAGAIGDLWMTIAALRFDASALIRDEEDSMRIFARMGRAGYL
ncbi:MAG: DUF3267 domain-containing protein [Anaerolineae bacterium]|nr:DUF3267 domain-containing protein [Anaerolineae bacterium]